MSRKMSEMLHSFSSIFSLPDSMRLMSSTSLMRESRWLEELMIFLRYSCTRSRLSMFVSASVVKPIMAFMGVRMSWDMLERKSVLARLAAFAASSAL